jgi:Lon protease-like protein
VTASPMFPLGTVLVPSAGLPLHVFEPRYRALVRDCLAGNREFGVVLIERGSEVGGDDVRSHLGTMAGLRAAMELPDGRWALATVGLRRIRVLRWLPDDPYPRAAVEDWPDPPPAAGHREALEPVLRLLRQALALATEAGVSAAPATVTFAEDPVLAGYQAAAVAPIGPLDRQRLLAARSPDVRVELMRTLLEEQIEMLRFRLGPSPEG